MKAPFINLPILAGLAIAGCAPTALPPKESLHREAAAQLQQAGTASFSAEQRAVHYLAAAEQAAPLLGSATSGEPARLIYNQAAANLTVLLRTADQGRRWNQTLTLTSGDATYHLRFAKATRDGVWDSGYFTGMTQSEKIPNGDLERRNLRSGVGGILVGNHRPATLPLHLRPCGINAAVTATLEFKGHEALLTLLDPSVRENVRISGAERPLAADFSAPLAAYPQGSETWNGLMGALRVDQHMKDIGLFMISPYDPDRIPVIFVHGLISTPRMWRRVINELEADPEFRRRYQCWIFSYPTGNPPLYSALRFRQELASIERCYPRSRPYVLVGHSMGGLVSQMQVTSLKREDWNVIGKDKAEMIFRHVKPGDLVDQGTRFQANPHVARVIFICTPHRGSKMALGTIATLGAKLISLPGNLSSEIGNSVGAGMSVITGDAKRMPTSATELTPGDPTLVALDHRPIQAPHHSIIGDRGKGDNPNGSDGVVEYWSSHLSTAKSEMIVPGPHGSCELPETRDELWRIFHLHLKEAGAQR